MGLLWLFTGIIENMCNKKVQPKVKYVILLTWSIIKQYNKGESKKIYNICIKFCVYNDETWNLLIFVGVAKFLNSFGEIWQDLVAMEFMMGFIVFVEIRGVWILCQWSNAKNTIFNQFDDVAYYVSYS